MSASLRARSNAPMEERGDYAGVLADGRWRGPHGIGRFAAEVLARLPGVSLLEGGRSLFLSPLDPLWSASAIRKLRPRVYFTPGFNPPLFSSAPFVLTLHDLIHHIRRWSSNTVKIAVAPKALDAFKQRIKEITCRVGGRSLTQVAEQLGLYLPGWKSYFLLAQTPKTFKGLDSWIRHRLRAVQLKHWRRGPTIYRGLRSLGAPHELAALVAGGGNRWWHHSQSGLNKVLTVAYFDSLGVPRLS